jgi:hypothetical protein
LVQRDKGHKAEGYLLHLHGSCHMCMQGRYPTISLQCLARRRSSVRPGMRVCTAIFSVRQMLPSVEYAREARCLATCTAILSVEEATITASPSSLLAFVPGTKRCTAIFSVKGETHTRLAVIGHMRYPFRMGCCQVRGRPRWGWDLHSLNICHLIWLSEVTVTAPSAD